MDGKASQDRFEFASGLVEEAGRLANGYFQKQDELIIKSKGLQDMASQADLAVEELIQNRLRARFPGDGFLGEETGRDELGSSECIWVVDPIDGTQPFVSGLGSWCVSIGLVVAGAIEMGFVAAPARGELFIGGRGRRATLNGKPISVSGAASLTEGLLGVGYSPRVPAAEYLPFFERMLREGGVYYRDGSGALSLCYAACGRLIGMVELKMNSWDCVGAFAVVEAAGGQINDFLGNDGLWNGNRVIAGPPRLYAKLEALFGPTK